MIDSLFGCRHGFAFAFGLSLMLCGSSAFAKDKKETGVVPDPVHLGNVLSPLGGLQMQTAEISAYSPELKTLFVVAGERVMEKVNLSDPSHPKLGKNIALMGKGSSVTVHGNLLAVSSLADIESDTGYVEIFKVGMAGKKFSIEKLSEVRPCHQPDMITFTPDGRKLLVACEGSPNPDFSMDPAGGIALLTLPEGRFVPDSTEEDSLDEAVIRAAGVKVNVLGFESLDSTALLAAGVRRIGNAPFSQTLEPEYITVSHDSKVAWVSLQENNAIARVDVVAETITDVFPLGVVDHSKPGFGLDVKNNNGIEIENVPVRGLRQPDGIANVMVDGKHFVLTANEGAPVNDYQAWTDESTVLKLFERNKLSQKVFDGAMLGKLMNLTVSSVDRCPEVEGGLCPYLTNFGTRSVSIFDGTTGALLWDSGDQLEQMLAKVAPKLFNWNSKKTKYKKDSRSTDKGCEPENVTVGVVGDRRYAFVGLERMSGVAVFDMTDWEGDSVSPKLVDYYMDPRDRGPEGLLFIDADHSPIPGQALLVVGYEYSKTLTIYKVN